MEREEVQIMQRNLLSLKILVFKKKIWKYETYSREIS